MSVDDRKRNVQPLLESRTRDSEEKTAKVTASLTAALQAGEAVSVAAIAKSAGVSRQFVYSKPGLTAEIEAARKTQHQMGVKGVRTNRAGVTANGLKTDLLHARDEITRLRDEVGQLRRELRGSLGAEIEAVGISVNMEALALRQQELDAARDENQRALRQLAYAQRQIDVLTDQLAAERTAHAESVRALTTQHQNVVPLR